VLCHGVIPYLPDPGPVLAAVCALARPGGVVSVLAKNAATMAVRPAYEGRWRDALAAFDADSEVNALGLHTRGDTVEDLALQLAELGVGDISWYGVRLFAEAWAPDHRVERDEVDDVLAVEVEASRRDPYRRLSRLFHLVGRRHA
jgi:hypothetical protein